MSTSSGALSAHYRIDPLKEDGGVPWKQQILAVIRDRKLSGYIDGSKARPVQAKPNKVEDVEKVAMGGVGCG